MSKVISKASVFSSAISHHDNDRNCRNFPMKFSVCVGKRGKLVGFSSLRSNFGGVRTVVDQNGSIWSHKKRNPQSIHAKLGLSIGKSQRWWEKELQPNMKEITSAEDLVDLLLKAGDQLVVVDFYSPGCGGCRALHPKICQLAEMNPDVQFLLINYEEHRSMCYSLNVHVLPFFRFYRGADGRVCSFSCTNATIKKFKDALAKYNTVRSNLGPAKGLEEKELLALSANKDLSFTYTPKPDKAPTEQEVSIATDTKVGAEESHVPPDRTLLNSPLTANSSQDNEEKTLVTARR